MRTVLAIGYPVVGACRFAEELKAGRKNRAARKPIAAFVHQERYS